MAEDESNRSSDAEEKKAPTIEQEAKALKEKIKHVHENPNMDIDENLMIEYLDYMWRIWADFQLTIIEPLIDVIMPPAMIEPATNPDTGQKENVFKIVDEGFRLTMSRGGEAYTLGQSMYKYFNTVEKIIALLVQRLNTGGVHKETEVRVAFYGYELGQRKAFESILNLQENVVVVNYDADEWGERFMKMVLELAERGYGMPPESPRKFF